MVAITIVRLTLLRTPAKTHGNILPSIMAMMQLHNCTVSQFDGFSGLIPALRISLILFLFTGYVPTKNIPEKVSAASINGICVFLSLLRSLDISPTDSTAIEVMPGHLMKERQLYSFLVDLHAPQRAHRENTLEISELSELSRLYFELVVEEQEESTGMGASYRSLQASELGIILRLTDLQKSLQYFLRNALPNLQDSGLPMKEHHNTFWTCHQTTLPADARFDEDLPNDANATWSILTHKCWTASAGNSLYHYDIEVQTSDCLALLAMADLLYAQ